FFLISTPIYWIMSGDPAGTTMMTLVFGLGALVSFFFLYSSRRFHPRPEDKDDGELEELAGEYGFFSPHSWWPLAAAGSAATVALGLTFGWRLFPIGAATAAIAVIGMVCQSCRGGDAP